MDFEHLGQVMKFITREMVNQSLNCDSNRDIKEQEMENYSTGIGSIMLVGSIEQLSDEKFKDNRLATPAFWDSEI